MRASRDSGTFPRLAIALATCLLACPAAHADGVFVYKELTFQTDDEAKAFRYESIEQHDGFVWVTAGGKRLRFDSTTPFTYAELTDALPPRIVTPGEIGALEKQLREIERISGYPAAAELARPTLELLREAKAVLDRDIVRDRGTWLSRSAYERDQTERRVHGEKPETGSGARHGTPEAAAAEDAAGQLRQTRERLAEARREVARLKEQNAEIFRKLNGLLKKENAR